MSAPYLKESRGPSADTHVCTRKVFTKLGITSRSQLDRFLPSDSRAVQPPG
jgi:hypothetical protein